jgi:uncharacterized damage-inducible protein DinB
MDLTQLFLSELQNEATNTRKMLEAVPSESLDWKPHEKSMPLGRLAAHTGEMAGWVRLILMADELNFATMAYKPPTVESNADLLAIFESNLADAIKVFEEVKDEAVYQQNWKLKQGDYVILEQPKHVVIRSMVLNHIVHHRAQLSVYLRLLDIPVPGMYGPSADEM